MSKYPTVTEQHLIDLRNLAEQQKNERTLKIENRVFKLTHDVKLTESFSPITKELDEFNESTQKIGEIVKESKTPQLAMENNHNAIPIENEQIQPGVIYDTSLENTLNNMKNNTGFFNIEERDSGEIVWNGFPVEKPVDKKLKINGEINNITPGIQKVFTQTSNIPIKKLNDKDNEIFINILKSPHFDNYEAIRGESKSGRYKQSKTIFERHKLKGHGIEKIIIRSNIIGIYTRLEILLGLKLSGHTDTLSEASNLIDELYRRGEIQSKQQYRNSHNKFSK